MYQYNLSIATCLKLSKNLVHIRSTLADAFMTSRGGLNDLSVQGWLLCNGHVLNEAEAAVLHSWLKATATPVHVPTEIFALHRMVIHAIAANGGWSHAGTPSHETIVKVLAYLKIVEPTTHFTEIGVENMIRMACGYPPKDNLCQPDFGRPPIGYLDGVWHVSPFHQVDAMTLYKNSNASRTSMHYQIVTLPLFQQRRGDHNVSCVNRVVVFREGSQVPLPEYVDAVKQFRLRGYVVRFEMTARSTNDVEVEVLGDTNAQRDCIVSGLDFSRVFGHLRCGHRNIDVMKELDNWLPQ